MFLTKITGFAALVCVCVGAVPGSALAVNYEDIYQPWDSNSSGQTKAHPKHRSTVPKVDYGAYSPAVTSDPRYRISVAASGHRKSSHRRHAAGAHSPGVDLVTAAPAALVTSPGSGSGWSGTAFLVLGLIAVCFVLRPRPRKA